MLLLFFEMPLFISCVTLSVSGLSVIYTSYLYVFLVAPWTQMNAARWVLSLCGRNSSVDGIFIFGALRPLMFWHVFFPPLWRHRISGSFCLNCIYLILVTFSQFFLLLSSCIAYLYISCVFYSSCYPTSMLNYKNFSPLRSKVSQVYQSPELLARIWSTTASFY